MAWLSLIPGRAYSGAKKHGSFETGSALDTYTKPYGMAGCGLGSLMIKKNDKSQSIAALLNITGLQTFAIASIPTSNCGLPAKVAQAEQKIFIAVNLPYLENDIATGGGEYSQALAQILGCDGTGQYAMLLKVGRDHFEHIFKSGDPEQVHQHLLDTLRGDSLLVSCGQA